jgi:hypothetical protein
LKEENSMFRLGGLLPHLSLQRRQTFGELALAQVFFGSHDAFFASGRRGEVQWRR